MAVDALDPQARTQDLWLVELARGVASRFTFDPEDDILSDVQSLPAPGGGKWQISKDGGVHPRWRRDGRELFYIANDERLMAVPCQERHQARRG